MRIQPSRPVRRWASPLATVAGSLLVTAAMVACSGSKAVENNGAGASAATGAPGTTVAVVRPPVPSAGCQAGPTAKVDNEKRTMNVAAMDRFYMYSSPAAEAAKPLPLVVDFHGLLEGAEVQTALSGLGPLGQQDGFVTATPNGSGTPLRWNTNPDTSNNPDLQFLDAMLEKIETDTCIDTARVYATGISYGAIMTSFLACNRSAVFAAFAPVSGITLGADCNQTRDTPMLAFHGTADPILYFNGGVSPAILAVMGARNRQPAESTTPTTAPPIDLNGKGYPATVAKWAALNDCDPNATDTNVTDMVIHRVYRCPTGKDVEFFIVIGGGHSWPGASIGANRPGALGGATQDLHASQEIWAFFQRFSLPT